MTHDTARLAFEALARSVRISTVPPSPGGETVVQVSFSWNTPSPTILQALVPGQIINRSSVLIVTPFDDPDATIEIGTSEAPDLVLGPNEITTDESGSQFSNESIIPITTSDFLLLTIDPGASTQGSGILLYKLK